MKRSLAFRILLLLSIFCLTSLLAKDSKLTVLIKNKNEKEIKALIKNVPTIDNLSLLPQKANDDDLLIFKNDEDKKFMYEYFNKKWSIKISKLLNDILNEENVEYVHSVNSKEFNPYTEEIKDKKTKDKKPSSVYTKFLDSDFTELAINNTIKLFAQKKQIQRDQIINIQLIPTSKTKCKIIFTYKQ